MRPYLVVFAPVVAHYHPRFRQRPQLFPIQALVPESSVETLHKTILPRAAWFNVDGLDPILRQPALHDLGNELRAVVTPQIFRGAVLVQVPYAFYRIIVDEDKGKPRVLGFKLEQGVKPTHNFDFFLIKVRAIEKETGLKFFSDLPDADKLKSKSPAFPWKLPKKK